MDLFAKLFYDLDATTSSKKKVQFLLNYFRSAQEDDIPWAVKLLSGEKGKRVFPSALLRDTLTDLADLKSWLVEESYAVVGDLAETLSLLSEPYCSHKKASFSLAELCEKILPLLAKQTGEEKKQWFIQEVLPLEARQRFVLIKVMTGGFRVGLSRQGVTKALALWQEVSEQEMTFRLSGSLKNPPTVLNEILRGKQTQGQHSQPYPFYLASPLTQRTQGFLLPILGGLNGSGME